MVRKIFGTDGIRGKVNSEFINAEFAQKLGIACGKYFLSKSGGERSNRVIIGKDTRRSGYMLETALTSGFTSIGMDVFLFRPYTYTCSWYVNKIYESRSRCNDFCIT
tara:strand:+ start:320 stop:640 length:321 start_codon:yes stop_codon:yes gene_type:complete